MPALAIIHQLVNKFNQNLVPTPLALLGGAQTATPQEHEQLRREIESTDRQIDQLVYQLYGLTDEEIKIVEHD